MYSFVIIIIFVKSRKTSKTRPVVTTHESVPVTVSERLLHFTIVQVKYIYVLRLSVFLVTERMYTYTCTRTHKQATGRNLFVVRTRWRLPVRPILHVVNMCVCVFVLFFIDRVRITRGIMYWEKKTNVYIIRTATTVFRVYGGRVYVRPSVYF